MNLPRKILLQYKSMTYKQSYPEISQYLDDQATIENLGTTIDYMSKHPEIIGMFDILVLMANQGYIGTACCWWCLSAEMRS